MPEPLGREQTIVVDTDGTQHYLVWYLPGGSALRAGVEYTTTAGSRLVFAEALYKPGAHIRVLGHPINNSDADLVGCETYEVKTVHRVKKAESPKET